MIKARTILLAFITIVFLYFLFSQDFSTSFFIYEDESYPRPIVEIELYCKNGQKIKTMENSRIEECIEQETIEFNVKLINNSSEPSLKGYDLAAGILLVVEGGRFIDYDTNDFQQVIGISNDLEVTQPLNVTMIEAFSNYIMGKATKQAFFKVRIDPSTEVLKISFRGWIMDEDKKVYNPITEENEYYVARYPVEDYVENPPDTRWAGKEFLKYKVYTIELT